MLMKFTKPFSKGIFKNDIFSYATKSFSSYIDYSFDTKDFLKKVEEYEENIKDRKNYLSFSEERIKGFATPDGTKNYSSSNKTEVHAQNFRKTFHSDLTLSSIGIGTYLGAPDDINDFYIYNAIKFSVLSGGVNVIDTSTNFRYTRSERTVGKALCTLINKYGYKRDQLFIGSKIGYVPEDAESGKRAHAFVADLVENNKITMDDIIFDEKNRPVHCVHPEFLRTQLNLSLDNLNIETLDLLCLMNFYETQGPLINPDTLNQRLSKAFEFLESARADGKIKYYGMSTWNSLRSNSSNVGVYSNLHDIVKLAEKVGGKDHGMRYIQVPINLMNPEAFVENYQMFEGPSGVIPGTLTAVANSLEVNLLSTSPLFQGHIVNVPLENALFNVKFNASKHIQIIRSIPAQCLKSTIIGMKQINHVRENLEVISVPPLTSKEFYDVLAPKKRKPFVEKEADIFK